MSTHSPGPLRNTLKRRTGTRDRLGDVARPSTVYYKVFASPFQAVGQWGRSPITRAGERDTSPLSLPDPGRRPPAFRSCALTESLEQAKPLRALQF